MCFSQASSDKHLAEALSLGMSVMLVAVGGMLAMIGRFIWRAEREHNQKTAP